MKEICVYAWDWGRAGEGETLIVFDDAGKYMHHKHIEDNQDGHFVSIEKKDYSSSYEEELNRIKERNRELSEFLKTVYPN